MRFKRTMGFHGSPGSHRPISIALSLKEHLSDRGLTQKFLHTLNFLAQFFRGRYFAKKVQKSPQEV